MPKLPRFKGFANAIRQSRAHSSPMRFILDYILRRLRWNERVIFTYEGCRFRLIDSPTARMMFYDANHWHGTTDVRFLKQFLRPGDVFVDIGANISSHCITLAKHLGNSSQIHAFEPHPRTFAYLEKNRLINRLDNLHTYNVALGDEDGEVFFSDVPWNDLNRVLESPEQEISALRVPVRLLDSYAFARSPITAIKLDVEGFELPVLRGATIALQNTQFLYFEVSDLHYEKYSYSTGDIVQFLDQNGWKIYRFVDESRVKPVVPSKTFPRIEQTQNWIATRSWEALSARIELTQVGE